jgi:hypothetical protein
MHAGQLCMSNCRASPNAYSCEHLTMSATKGLGLQIHYDNVGTDSGEAFEVIFPTGTAGGLRLVRFTMAAAPG